MKDKTLRYILKKAANPYKALKIWLKKKLGWLGTPVIVPYTAYSNGESVVISGAVIEDKGLAKPGLNDPLWKNVLTMIKRYSGDEIAGVSLKIEYAGQSRIAETDKRGIFRIRFRDPTGDSAGREVKFSLLDAPGINASSVNTVTKILEIGAGADFILVSDIDDTVMVSHATRILKKLRLMLAKNALTRKPFPGVAAFYQALSDGASGRRPVFYVSSSEWNLFDLLKDFLQFRGIPSGTLLLSDKKLKLFRIGRSGRKHDSKFSHISHLFEFFPGHHFILIGDSGQRDPEIYLQIAEMYPERVKAIYIRCIKSDNKNKRLKALQEEAFRTGTEMIPVLSTTEAAAHAVERGFITEEQFRKIGREKKRDS